MKLYPNYFLPYDEEHMEEQEKESVHMSSEVVEAKGGIMPQSIEQT